jgi:hypothetical protein
LLLLIKKEKRPDKDIQATFYYVFVTPSHEIAETFLPSATCTTLERAKMVQLETPESFMP